MQVTPTKNSGLKDCVILESREEMSEVVEYINNTVRQQNPLDYYIEGFFDADELFEALNEDLPISSYNIGRKQFINDMINLSERFFKLTESKNIRFQLEIIKTDMCRLFHVDNMKQRLLCTYVGPGTEWLGHSNVHRDGLGKGCNDKIVKDFKQINRAKPFEVLVLKGAKSDGKEFAIVHRSPPVEKDLRTRVLLKIDECIGRES